MIKKTQSRSTLIDKEVTDFIPVQPGLIPYTPKKIKHKKKRPYLLGFKIEPEQKDLFSDKVLDLVEENFLKKEGLGG